MNIDPRLNNIVAAQPYPLLFATISGAHLYGFPSPDSDYDLRGAHVLPLDAIVAFHQHEYERLRIELQAAHDASQLPELPSDETRQALNDLLVRTRLHGTTR